MNDSTLLTQDMFLARFNPSPVMLAGDRRDEMYLTDRATALKLNFIEANQLSAINLIKIEIVRESGDVREVVAQLISDEQLPLYSYVVFRKNNKAASLYYFLEETAVTPKAIDYCRRAELGLLITLEAHGTSTMQNSSTAQNPLSSSFDVEWGTAHEYTVKELNAFADQEIVGQLYRARNNFKIDPASKNARNDIFKAAAQWAYPQFRKDSLNVSIFVPKLEQHVHELNSMFTRPAKSNDLEAIVRDITGFVQANVTAEDRPEWIARQTMLSHRTKRVRMAPAKWAAVLELVAEGKTDKQIAELGTFGKTPAAVRGLIRRAKMAATKEEVMETSTELPSTSGKSADATVVITSASATDSASASELVGNVSDSDALGAFNVIDNSREIRTGDVAELELASMVQDRPHANDLIEVFFDAKQMVSRKTVASKKSFKPAESQHTVDAEFMNSMVNRLAG